MSSQIPPQLSDLLEGAERRFEDTVALFPATICEMHMNLRITYTNQYGLELFGYTREDVEKTYRTFDFHQTHTALLMFRIS